ncbi:MAG: hypothetical protein ACRDA5_08350 [Clostridium sp.]
MTFKEMVDMVNNFIDEQDSDPQVITIVKQAINSAYMTIGDSVDKTSIKITKAYSKVIDLPMDLNTIIDVISGDSILTTRDYSFKADKILMHTTKYTSLDIYYTKKTLSLVSDADVLLIDEKYIQNIVLYGAYIYYLHRKKVELANILSKDLKELIQSNLLPSKIEIENVDLSKQNKK